MIIPDSKVKPPPRPIHQRTEPEESVQASFSIQMPPPPSYSPPAAETRPLLGIKAAQNPRSSALRRFVKGALIAVVLLGIAGGLSNLNLGRRPGPYDSSRNWGKPVDPGPTDGYIEDCSPDWSESRKWTLPDDRFSFASSTTPQIPQFRPPSPDGQWPPDSPDHGPPRGDHPSGGPHGPFPDHGPPGPHDRNRDRVGNYQYRARFQLPPTDLAYFVARGSHSQGVVAFEPTPDVNELSIEVEAFWWSEMKSQHFKICRLKRTDGSRGLGVFTPSERWSWLPYKEQTIHFKLTVNVPVHSGMTPELLTSLESSLPNFSHFFGGFETREFNLINLHGTNGRVGARWLSAHNISIHTTNAPIFGNFSSDRRLELITTNGGIRASITMTNTPSRTPHESANVKLQTSNAHINSTLNLITPASRLSSESMLPSGGLYSVSATTSNGPLALHVPLLPLLSNLSLISHTSNAAAQVQLSRTFEGSFVLATSNAKTSAAVINQDNPYGRSSPPTLHYTGQQGNRRTEGCFFWPDGNQKDCKPGQVDVKTSNGPVELVFI